MMDYRKVFLINKYKNLPYLYIYINIHNPFILINEILIIFINKKNKHYKKKKKRIKDKLLL